MGASRCCHATTTVPNDDLVLARLVAAEEDGQLALVAYWAEERRDSVVLLAHMLACYEMEN
jgi:hypothetical protein